MTVLDVLNAEKDLVHLASLGDGRELFRVPIVRVEPREPFKSLRANDPDDDAFKVLQRSVGERGIFYPPLVFAQILDAIIRLFLIDGHQRYRAARDRGDETIVVCICINWTSEEEALRDGVSAQFARFAVGEEDILSIAATGKVSIGEMVTLTGFSESKVRMLFNVAQHPRLAAVVKERLVSASRMSSLIKRCESNPGKLEALKNTVASRADHARREGKKWRNRIDADRSKKWDKKARQKADPSSYFASEDWGAWMDALGEAKLSAQIVSSPNGPILDLGPKTKLAIRVGDDDEWADTFALYNFGELKHEDVDLASLGDFVEDLPTFCTHVKGIYATLCAKRNEATKVKRSTSNNPIEEEDEIPDTVKMIEQSVEDVHLLSDSDE